MKKTQAIPGDIARVMKSISKKEKDIYLKVLPDNHSWKQRMKNEEIYHIMQCKVIYIDDYHCGLYETDKNKLEGKLVMSLPLSKTSIEIIIDGKTFKVSQPEKGWKYA